MYNKLTKLFHRYYHFTILVMKKIQKILRHFYREARHFIKKTPVKKLILLALIGFFIAAGLGLIWVTSFNLPDLDSFEERRVAQSTKIYDRTGEVVLFDVHGNIKRTIVPFDQISDYMKKATVAIEDENFYEHNGIKISSIFRAILTNLKNGDLLGGQGGSTITQQVIKNALLTSDKKISRKVKEWVLAPRLEKVLSKDEILAVYLNEVPFGGTIYGIEEASRQFFSKEAKDLSLVESAYLAALPQAPTFYSPFGNNTDKLEDRKNLVLRKMLENGFITEDEYNSSKDEKVIFEKPESFGIKAPHFVIYIRELLEEKYGKEVVEEGGLKVITTLDYELQKEAEEIVKRRALENVSKFDAENASLTAIDPKTGQILVMVGSRDYFDEEIDGNVNIALAKRQPGSSIKPIIYASAFNKGFYPETVVFDVPTEFSTACSSGGNCYNPSNFDGRFRGPISLRSALAQSINIPAVKVFYLAGLTDSLNLAKDMGLSTLTNIKQYGLTLVLGGGEVRPIDMATAYGVFANEGVKNDTTGILLIEDKNGNKIEEFKPKETRVLSAQNARQVSSILSDNVARTPMFGPNSLLYFGGSPVAAKTGTTNDYRDAWVVGYTPTIAAVGWAGNNDNTPMAKQAASSIVTPLWHEFMNVAMKAYPSGGFTPPSPVPSDTKPILRGFWQGENTVTIDKTTGEIADEFTPNENKQVTFAGSGAGVHSILYWVNKNDPNGPAPSSPQSDPQFSLWEVGVQGWLSQNNLPQTGSPSEPSAVKLNILSPDDGGIYLKDREMVITALLNKGTIATSEIYINGTSVGSLNPVGSYFTFVPEDLSVIRSRNILRLVVQDTLGNAVEETIEFSIQ